MPVRTIEIELFNKTGFPLQQTAANLCHGDWRPTGMPPAIIPAQAPNQPDASGKIRAESDGVMTGTEGFVKYKITNNENVTNTVHIYWSNPYIGTTVIQAQCHGHDYPMKCGVGRYIPEGTTYPAVPVRFEVVQEGRSNLANTGDRWPEYSVMAAAPPGGITGFIMLVADGGILAHAKATLSLIQVDTLVAPRPAPSFLPIPGTSYRPLVGEDENFWTGRWRFEHPNDPQRYIHIEIGTANGGQIAIDDKLGSPPFSHKEQREAPLVVASRPHQGDRLSAVRIGAQLEPLVKPPAGAGNNPLVGAATAHLHRLAAEAASHVQFVDTYRIGDDCTLQAYGEFEESVRVNKKLRYYRKSRVNDPVCDVLLGFQGDIR
jgi:hypothetical protein